MRRTTLNIAVLSATLALGATSLSGCEQLVEQLGGGSFSSLKKLNGSVNNLSGRSVKLVALVRDQRFPATIKRVAKADNHEGIGFEFTDLPAGPKSLLAVIDGVTYSVKWPKSDNASASLAGFLPETSLTDDEFDVGELTLSGDHVRTEHNPFAQLIDTDQDGQADFFDTDLDGDGVLNWDDPDIYGDFDEYEDWGWGEEYDDTWDEDGDGFSDWEDDDYSGGEWGEGWDSGYDPWSDWDATGDPCINNPELPECGGEVDCVEFPNDPTCVDDFCNQFPDDPDCQF